MSAYRTAPYYDGIRALLSDLRKKDQGLTHEEVKQIPEVEDQLVDQGRYVWQALFDSYDVVDEHHYNTSMTFYARRIDPQFYQDYENWDYGLSSNKPTVKDLPPVTVEKDFFKQMEEALNRK